MYFEVRETQSDRLPSRTWVPSRGLELVHPQYEFLPSTRFLCQKTEHERKKSKKAEQVATLSGTYFCRSYEANQTFNQKSATINAFTSCLWRSLAKAFGSLPMTAIIGLEQVTRRIGTGMLTSLAFYTHGYLRYLLEMYPTVNIC